MTTIRILIVTLLVTLGCFFSALAQEAPSFDRPINPDLYLIRPGDKLLVTFLRSKVQPLDLQVDLEGRIVHETIGIIDVSSKTLAESRSVLEEALRKLYNVNEIAVSIGQPRLVSITVLGAVHNPGTYRGYTSQRVSEMIQKAGGILPDGSKRWVDFSGGPKELRVDLDRAAYLGELDSDPYIYAGQVVFVPNRSGVAVNVVGEVNSPREIELIESDDLRTLLMLAGGLRSTADGSAVRIISRSDDHPEGVIENGDIIVVPARITAEQNQVAIFGAVKVCGMYDLADGMTVGNLIESAGGLLAGASGRLTTVFRKPVADVSGRVTDLRFPISHLTRNGDDFSTIRLRAQDSVFVPLAVGYVSVKGEVSNPGYYPFVEGKDAMYYISTAGGFLSRANKTEISVYNPISNITGLSSPGVVIGDGSEVIVNVREELK